MNGLELFLLGRKLTRIGEQAIPNTVLHELPPSVRAIAIDVTEHPDSSVSEIVGRTGYRQSQVSAAVERLRAVGAVLTSADPADRRRTLVRAHPDTPRRAAVLASEPIDAAIAAALTTDDPRALEEVARALDVLSRHLGLVVADG